MLEFFLVLIGATYLYLVIKEGKSALRVVSLLNERNYFPEAPPGLQWVTYFVPYSLYMLWYCISTVFVDMLVGVFRGTMFKTQTEEDIQALVSAMMDER